LAVNHELVISKIAEYDSVAGVAKVADSIIFPPPGRAPRRKKRALKAELVSKVKSLEQKVWELEDEDISPQSDTSANDEETHSNNIARHSVSRSQKASYPTASARDELEGQFG
jgi:hypothetical protein